MIHAPPIARILLVIALASIRAAAPAQPAASQPAPPQPPASQPATTRPFQPGVQIDWAAGAVLASARVVLREGPLEFFAAFAGKEHESILRFDGRPLHIRMALGLAGMQPGTPPMWNDAQRRYVPPSGDLLDARVRWTDPGGATREAAAHDWLLDVEFDRTPWPRPWVFGGSVALRDGGLAADRSGAGIALVDMPDALLSPSRSRSSRDGDLWVVARSDAIPPLDTPVTVVFTPARPHPLRIVVDHRGLASIGGQWISEEDACDLIASAQQLAPRCRVTIELRGVLRSERAAWVQRLRAAGVDADAVEWIEAPDSLATPSTTPSTAETAP